MKRKKQISQIALISILSVIVFVGCTTGEPGNDSTALGATTSTSQSTETTSSNISETTNSMSNEEKYNAYDAAPPTLSKEELQNFKTVVMKTSKGDITLELDIEKAPITVSNFAFLMNEDFYDGLTFHRREEGFVIQGGDPLGTGIGGPGYQVEGEVDNGLKHTRGAIAMARQSDAVNPEKKSSGSQFYITLDDVNFLDGEYTVFGYVTEGMDVADKIQIGDTITNVVVK